MYEPLTIRSHRGDYSVRFVEQTLPVLQESLCERDVMILDKNVAGLYPELAGFAQKRRNHLIAPYEEAKTYQALTPLLESLIAGGFTKTDRLVAVGGGIVQDITAFTASILFRGVPWLFFPTNLLSQCDSCIGSKTSINFGAYKNLLGGFYPPREIYVAPSMLATLADQEIRSGLGEMMHYFCVASRADWEWAQPLMAAAVKQREGLPELIYRSLSIKKAMVERDEFDQGPRNVFNYGHSFGHALESATDFAVPHGIAVGFGMDLANLLSARQKLIPMALRNELRASYALVWQDTDFKELNFARYFDALCKDKKNEGTQIKVILTRGLGQMFKTTLSLDQDTRHFIQDYFQKKRWKTPL
ncbi:MAG: 3-dehydroquinate synthase [Lentisphaerota bacterium]